MTHIKIYRAFIVKHTGTLQHRVSVVRRCVRRPHRYQVDIVLFMWVHLRVRTFSHASTVGIRSQFHNALPSQHATSIGSLFTLQF